GFAGLGDDRLLAGDQTHRLGGRFQVLLFLRRSADSHVHDDFFQSRQRELILAAESFSERRLDLLEVFLLEARRRQRASRFFGGRCLLVAFGAFFTLLTLLTFRTLFALLALGRLGGLVARFSLGRLGGLFGFFGLVAGCWVFGHGRESLIWRL